MARRFDGSRADDREDARNAEKFCMTVAEWKRTAADVAADRVGQRKLEMAEKDKGNG